MSQFPQPLPGSTLQRPRFAFDSTTPAPAVPVDGTFSASDPTVAGDQGLAQLAGAMHAVTNTVGMLGNRQDQINQNAEIAQAKQERAAERARIVIETAAKNAGAESALLEAVSANDGIKQGTVKPTEADNGDPEQWVDRLVREKTAGFPPAYADEYRRVFAPKVLRSVYGKMEADRKAAFAQQEAGLQNRILGTENPEELDSVIQDARKLPGMADYVNGIAAKAMIGFAKNNNEGMVNAIKASLGVEEVGQQDYADRLLEVAKSKAETERNQQFANDAATIRKQGFDNNTSADDMKKQIEDSAKNLGIEQRVIEQQTNGLNAEIERKRNEELKQHAFEIAVNGLVRKNTSMVAHVITENGSVMGARPAGFGTRPDFAPIPGLPPELGSTEAQKTRFYVEARRQTGVDINNIDTTDAENVDKWTQYFRGTTAARVVDAELKSRLLSLDFNATDPTKPAENSQKNLLAAQTYAMLHGINATAASMMVDGDPRAKAFYDSVMIQMQTPGAVMTPTIIRTATAIGGVDPKARIQPTDKDYQAIQSKAPNLTDSMMQYAVRTYRGQLDHGSIDGKGVNTAARDYAVQQAQSRGVQLWQSWLGWTNHNAINPLAWFAKANDSPIRPLVDLGTLATVDASVRPAIGTAMESLLEERAAEFNKNAKDSSRLEGQDLRLNYVGSGVWQVEGINVGALTADQEALYHVTHDQIVERMAKLEPKELTTAQLQAKLDKVQGVADQYAAFAKKDPQMAARLNTARNLTLAELASIKQQMQVRALTDKKKAAVP